MTLRAAFLAAGLLVASLASAQFYGYKEQPIPGSSRVATEASGGIRYDQKLRDFVPMDVELTDENGRAVRLGEFFGRRPVVLMLVFYRCSGICTDEFVNMAKSVEGMKQDFPGQTYDIVTVSIDPKETPDLARAKKLGVIDEMGTDHRIAAQKGWHFLVGSEAQVRRLADAVGFRYSYDAKSGNIVHPAGIVVLTPRGQIAQYFLTTEYPTKVLLNTIKDAAQMKTGVRDQRPFFLACIQIDPLTGQRTINILNTLKTFGLVTLIVLVFSVVRMTLRRRATIAHGGDPTA